MGRMRAAPLPEGLGPRFSVSAAREAGVPASRLRRGDLQRPFHGVRVTAHAVGDDARDRFGAPRGELERAHIECARRYAPRMTPHECFSHVTAAVLWDIPLPRTLLEARPIDVAVPAPYRSPRSRGIRGHQFLPAAMTVVREPRTGLPVPDPATTWVMLASVISDVRDIIAAGDAVVRDWRVSSVIADVDDLRRAIDSRRRPGVIALRQALPLIRTRSASRPETRTRLELIDGGLPEPELNIEVWEGGVFLGAVDLAYRALRIAIEYEGEHHLTDAAQWAYDISRYDRMREAGWIVIRVTKGDVFGNPSALRNRVRVAIASRA